MMLWGPINAHEPFVHVRVLILNCKNNVTHTLINKNYLLTSAFIAVFIVAVVSFVHLKFID